MDRQCLYQTGSNVQQVLECVKDSGMEEVCSRNPIVGNLRVKMDGSKKKKKNSYTDLYLCQAGVSRALNRPHVVHFDDVNELGRQRVLKVILDAAHVSDEAHAVSHVCHVRLENSSVYFTLDPYITSSSSSSSSPSSRDSQNECLECSTDRLTQDVLYTLCPKKFFIFFIFSPFHVYRVPIRYTDELRNGSVLLRHGLNFSRAWWMIQLIIGKKDWKHVSVQKVVTLNICCNVACLTFHLPHITTSSFQSHQCQPTTGSFQIH